MIRLKITDESTLFPDKEQHQAALSSFPNDPKGDLIIKLFDKSFNLQKNILGKNSAYFGQLATIKSLHMIEIQNQEINARIFQKFLLVLYGQCQEFQLNELTDIYNSINFLRTKDVKSQLVGEIKKLSQKGQTVQEQLNIFQFAFENQIMAISGYYTDILQKNNFITNFDLYYKPHIKILSEKSLTVLLSSIYNLMVYESKQQEIEINSMFYKIIDYFCLVKTINSAQMKLSFEKLLNIKKEKLILKEDQKKDITQVVKELRDLRQQQDLQQIKIEDMKKQEKKHQHIINNLTQKVKLLEKAIIYYAQDNEQIKNLLKPKKKKKSEEKIMKMQQLIQSDRIISSLNSLQIKLQDENIQNEKTSITYFAKPNKNISPTSAQISFMKYQLQQQESPNIQFFNRNKEIQQNKFFKINDVLFQLERLYDKDINTLLAQLQIQEINLIYEAKKNHFIFNESARNVVNTNFIMIIQTKNFFVGFVLKNTFDKNTDIVQEGFYIFKLNPFQIIQMKDSSYQFEINSQYLQFGDYVKIVKNIGLFQLNGLFEQQNSFLNGEVEIINIQIFYFK